MSAKLITAVVVGAVAVVAGALNLPKASPHPVQKPQELVGMAPDFTAKSPDGKTHTLAELIKNGPGYLYFIKKDCPINAKAVTFYNRLYKQYGADTPLLGVFNGSADEYKDYQKEHAMPFPVVLDPDQKIITNYQAERSPWVVEVKQNGTVGHIWKGYSQDYLQQINGALAGSMKLAVAKVDFSAAPIEPRYG